MHIPACRTLPEVVVDPHIFNRKISAGRAINREAGVHIFRAADTLTDKDYLLARCYGNGTENGFAIISRAEYSVGSAPNDIIPAFDALCLRASTRGGLIQQIGNVAEASTGVIEPVFVS